MKIGRLHQHHVRLLEAGRVSPTLANLESLAEVFGYRLVFQKIEPGTQA